MILKVKLELNNLPDIPEGFNTTEFENCKLRLKENKEITSAKCKYKIFKN